MKKRYIKFIVFSFIILLWPIYALEAATVFFERDKANMAPGQQFELPLYLNTEPDDINAFEGQVYFPADLLKIKDIYYHNSFINFWVEEPRADNNSIVFSGIVPGGYSGKKSLVLTIIFEAIGIGQGQIGFGNLALYLNDGVGTLASVDKEDWNFEINRTEPIIINEIKPIVDSDSPENFTPIITRIPEIAGNDYVLVFATQDKGSGIDYFEVKEGGGNFVKAESPYVLKNQSLDKKIVVRAVDKKGNVREVIAQAGNDSVWYENYWIFVIIIALILGPYFFGIILGKKQKINKASKKG